MLSGVRNLPLPGIEPVSLQWKHKILTAGPLGKSCVMFQIPHVSGIACLLSDLLHLAHSGFLFCARHSACCHPFLSTDDRASCLTVRTDQKAVVVIHMWRVAPFTVIHHPASVPTAGGRGHDLPRPYSRAEGHPSCRECCPRTALSGQCSQLPQLQGTLTTGMPPF